MHDLRSTYSSAASAARSTIAQKAAVSPSSSGAALVHPIRGFTDRRRAAREAFDEIAANDAAYRRVATNIVKRGSSLRCHQVSP
jgi:hypothetical protein